MKKLFNIEKLNNLKARSFLALSIIFEEYGKLSYSSNIDTNIKNVGIKSDGMPFMELENSIKILSNGCDVYYVVYFENDYIKEDKYCNSYEDAERYLERIGHLL